MDAYDQRKPGEIAFALLFIVFSAAAFWQSYEISGFSGASSAGVFPMVASATMILCSLVVLWGALRKPDHGKRGVELARDFGDEILPVRHVLVFGLVAAYLFALPLFGFLISSALFLFVSFQLLWRKHVLVSLVLAGVSIVAVYIVFRVVFQVVLPSGSLTGGLL